MKASWQRLLALIVKEFRQLMRDKSNLILGIGMPLFLILIFGYALSYDVSNSKIAVVTPKISTHTQDLIEKFQGSPYFSVEQLSNMKSAQAHLVAQEVDAVLAFSDDFEAQLAKDQAKLQVLVNGTDPTRASVVSAYIQGIVASWASQHFHHLPPAVVQLETRMWFNVANNSTWYLVPGLIVLIMTLVGTFLTALVMAREWERGTLESMFVTPVRSVEVLIAKIIPYFCVGMVGMLMCVLAAKFLFAVPIYGSYWVIALASMLYMLVSLGIGLLISSATKNQFVASQIALLVSFLPAMMLSGFVFDLRNVPDVVFYISQILPASYFMELIRNLFLVGNNLPLIIKDCLMLLLFSMIYLYLAHVLTRKRLD